MLRHRQDWKQQIRDERWEREQIGAELELICREAGIKRHFGKCHVCRAKGIKPAGIYLGAGQCSQPRDPRNSVECVAQWLRDHVGMDTWMVFADLRESVQRRRIVTIATGMCVRY